MLLFRFGRRVWYKRAVTRAGLYAVFFISGICGLIYQVIWVRQFGLIFDNTIYSAAFVSGLFLFGLGLGSYLAGSFSDRRHAEDAAAGIKHYALAEVAIALLGLGLALCFPYADTWGAALLSYTQSPEGWNEISLGSRLIQYLFSALFLLPSSLLMGATLTFLMRVILKGSPSTDGVRTGLLYGFNTLGAATGSFIVDLYLVPYIGLLQTQLTAVYLNLLAAAVAYLIYKRFVPHAQPEEPAPEVTDTPNVVRLTSMAVFLSGFAAMGMEILWFRSLTSAVGQFRVMFSLLLMTILVGMWLGSVLGGALTKVYRHPQALYIASQLLFIATTAFALLHFDVADLGEAVNERWQESANASWLADTKWSMLSPILKMVAVPSIFMGFAFPLAIAIVQQDKRVVGQRTGVLYLWNSCGVMAGTLATGFLFLPTFGTKHSVLILMAVAALCIVPLVALNRSFVFRPALPSAILAGLVLVASIPVVQLSALEKNDFIAKTFRIFSKERRKYFKEPYLLSASEGPSESIVVLDVPRKNEENTKFLLTNGHAMSSTSRTARRYMRGMAHVPLLLTENPTDALVICFGVGNTAHAISLHPTVHNVEVADLSKHVIQHARFFEDINGGVLQDEKVTVFVNDGRMHLKMMPEGSYDLVTLEPPPISFAGMASLYSTDFYELAKSRLKSDGFVTQWLPISQLPGDAIRSLIRAFVDVFPDSALLATDPQNYLLMGRKKAGPVPDLNEVFARLQSTPELLADLESINLRSPADIQQIYRSTGARMLPFLEGVPPITDDFPKMEYGGFAYASTPLPPELLGVPQ